MYAHTLTCAASGVLQGVGAARDIKSPLHAAVAEHVYPEKQREVFRLMNEAQNFFKHADRDSYASLTFRPEATAFLLFEASVVHSQIAGYFLPETYIFTIWMCLKYPHIMTDGPTKQVLTGPQAKAFNPNYRDVVLGMIDWVRGEKGDRIPITAETVGA